MNMDYQKISKMEKKKYIKPNTTSVNACSKYHLLSGSKEGANAWNSRKVNTDWDDEEEEIEDSMWK
jgi:hypothetical protein